MCEYEKSFCLDRREIIKLLIKNGANVDAEDDEGNTPKDIAVLNGDLR